QACPICGTPQCSCRGANEPLVGRPLELAAIQERADGTMTRVRAEEDILRAKPGQVGAYEVLYHKGDYVREEDLEALGLGGKAAKPKAAPAEDKAKRGPREAPKRASRDKALSEPKED
ncbi:MAG TPA: hypothetical protein VFP09_09400, partial [Desertimonas sp.]|nr:hypothetical protein [Desertimonas sp.]